MLSLQQKGGGCCESTEKNIEEVDKNIPITRGLVKKTDHITIEIENKILSVTGFVTTAALNKNATRD